MLHQAMKGNRVEIAVANDVHGDRDLEIDFGTFDQKQVTSQPITSQIGIWPPAPEARVSKVVEDSPAEAAGLMPNDQILSVDGELVANWFEMASIISQKPGQTLRLAVLRDGDTFELEIVPNTVVIEDKEYGQIGLYRPQPESTKLRFGPLESIWQSLDYNWRMTIITMRSLGRMVTAQMSSENLSGPITIARIAGQTAESGFSDFMKFLAIISISLGLLNLLPIPVLDGGHLMYFLYEAISGREPSERVMIWGQQFGFVMIAMLMVLAFYNDIMRLL